MYIKIQSRKHPRPAPAPAPTPASAAPAFWSYAFRPFFIAASLWAAIAVSLWMAVLLTGRTPPSRFDPLSWHIHEMLFGFVPAAIAGFLFTAIPTWTGRPALQGARLAGLLGLWILGRLACLWSARLPWSVAAGVDPAFEWVVCVIAARDIVLARNWRNLIMPLPVAVLGIANLMMYLSLTGLPLPPSLGWQLGLAAIVVLVSAVGGLIIPAFTQNWLLSRGKKRPLRPAARLDRLGMAALHSGLLGWALFPHSRLVAALLLLAAVLMGHRLLRWRGFATLSEPLLAILHLGYGWMILGAAMLGGSILSHWVPLPAAIHTLTIGAIGTMVLAVMTRVSLGHTGRVLHASRTTTLIYALISAALLCRAAAAFPGAPYLRLITAASAFWVASFIVFAAEYGPTLTAPRIPAPASTPGPRDARTTR